MTDFLLLAFIFLIAGVIAVPIASRLGLGSVLGYLIAGIVISPILALLGVDVISIQHFAEFGVVMMLFLVGLELEPKTSLEHAPQAFGAGGRPDRHHDHCSHVGRHDLWPAMECGPGNRTCFGAFVHSHCPADIE